MAYVVPTAVATESGGSESSTEEGQTSVCQFVVGGRLPGGVRDSTRLQHGKRCLMRERALRLRVGAA